VSIDDQKRWNKRYSVDGYRMGHKPRYWLRCHEKLLPKKGRALDIASGEGQNALYLANLGLTVDALDISSVGLEKTKSLANSHNLKINTILVDLEKNPDIFSDKKYDLIICFRYLQRNLVTRIQECLVSGGLAILEIPGIKTLERLKDRSKEHLIPSGELATWFPKLETIDYQETWDEAVYVSRIISRKP
jgi:SAM-dependent methyltransferase